MDQEKQDKIDAYLLRRMPEEERIFFEHEVEKDADLKEQLEFTECIRDAIISRCKKLSMIKEWEDFYEMEYYQRDVVYCCPPRNFLDKSILDKRSVRTKDNLLTNNCLYWVLGIAAAVIVILGIVFFILRATF